MSDDNRGDDIRALESADPAARAQASSELRDRISGIPSMNAPVQMRHGRRWLVPVAASAALVAALGLAYARGAGGPGLSEPSVPIAVETGEPTHPAEPIELGTDLPGGSLSTSVELQMGAQSDVFPDVGFGWEQRAGRNRFILPTLDTASTEASVFAVDPAVHASAEDAVRMSAALSVPGDVRPSDLDGGWVVGDYSGKYFSLGLWGEAYFQSGIPDALTVCENSADALYGRQKINEDGTWAFGQEMIRCMADTPPPSDDLVNESVSLFLAAIGIDESSTEITTTADSEQTITATAAMVVENNATEIVARVTVSASGIMYASGPTGEIVSLGSYSVVSPAEAGERLSQPEFAARMVSSPADSPDPMAPSSATAPPTAPEPSSPVPWRIDEREIVSVRLGLALLPAALNGDRYLVPTYEFTASDDTVWSVIALTEDDLDTSPDSE